MQKYKGGCHCGKVTFEVETDFGFNIECNCSHCDIKGLILTFVPASQFKLISGEDDLSDYHFNKHVIDHLFCKTCGVQAFGRGQRPDGTPTIAINLRALKDFDRSTVTITPFDGKSK